MSSTRPEAANRERSAWPKKNSAAKNTARLKLIESHGIRTGNAELENAVRQRHLTNTQQCVLITNSLAWSSGSSRLGSSRTDVQTPTEKVGNRNLSTWQVVAIRRNGRLSVPTLSAMSGVCDEDTTTVDIPKESAANKLRRFLQVTFKQSVLPAEMINMWTKYPA